MHARRRLRAILGALVLGAALTVTTTNASSAMTAAQTGSNPFSDQNVFCKKHAVAPGNRNASSPGVTPSSITIVDMSIDSVALRRFGSNLQDFLAAYKAYWNEVNKCGGINGRKLVLKTALYNPLAPDLAGHRQALCLRVTEDFKALVNVGIGMPQMQRCVSVNHRTISFAAAETPSSDYRDSRGRIVSIYPASDMLAEAFIKDGKANGIFRGKKVGVLAAAVQATSTQETRREYVEELKRAGIDAELEMLPCTGTVCTQGIGPAISRLKSKGVDLVVLAHTVTVASVGSVFREMRAQSFRAQVWGPDIDAIHSDSNMKNFVRTAGADGAAWAAQHGFYSVAATIRNGWRTGQVKEAPYGRMCQQTVAKALNQRVYQYGETDIGNARWPGMATVCTYVRSLARAIHSLGNNVTTDRLVVALRNQTVNDRRDTTPIYRNKQWYSGSDVRPSHGVTHKFNFPCRLPRATDDACMITVDRPARARVIRY